jgi:hypothetical protein
MVPHSGENKRQIWKLLKGVTTLKFAPTNSCYRPF